MRGGAGAGVLQRRWRSNYDPHQWHTVPADQPGKVADAPQQYVQQPGTVYTTEPV